MYRLYYLRSILEPSFLTVTCSVLSPSEYLIWIFWEMTSGIIPCAVLLVRHWKNGMASVYEVMASFTYFLRERELGS